MRDVRHWLAGIGLVVAACVPGSGGPSPGSGAGAETCDGTYRAWIANAEALSAPGADMAALRPEDERLQRLVFERCSLAAAERLNVEVPISIGDNRGPMIESGFRTFAEAECVAKSPLLDGTALCAEVGH